MTAQDGEGESAGAQAGGNAPQISEQEIQQAMAASQSMRQQLAQIDEQQSYVDELLTETRQSREALQGYENLEEGEEMLFPLGAGNFVRGRVADAGQVLTDLGTGIHLEGGVDTALERLQEREKSLTDARERLDQEAERVTGELQRVNQMLQQFQGGL